MNEDKPDPARDLAALAREACDLWQEHLASYANDARGKAELMRMMAPTHRLFAEWATLMQNSAYGGIFGKGGSSGAAGGKTSGTAGVGKSAAAGSAASRSEAAGPASDGSALELAELADRVARLEEQLARLEHSSAGKTPPSHPTSRPRAKS
jgi:hypothetical protein